ncbi:MAG: DUF5667 domain-containing protein [Candidatus Gottesmanbacteria bacterium]|nr:DUF5667 domain-containing protein [Candidatus Gottesmanbacteria bacterium]
MKIKMMYFVGLLTFFIVATSRPAYAAVPSSKTVGKPTVVVTLAPVIKAATVIEKKQEYLLPFPGILPDHPLYFLKQIRDGIMDRLIVDPLRKAEFLVLQADKRLNMGKVLIEQGKGTLAEEVISKGEKYMERAVSTLAAYKSIGRPAPAAMTDKLVRSMEKHREVMTEMIADTTGPVQLGLTGSFEFVKKLQGEVEKLK